jgi:hypothetical protein
VVDHLGGDFVVQIPDCIRKRESVFIQNEVGQSQRRYMCEKRGRSVPRCIKQASVGGEKRGWGSRSPIFSRVNGRSETKYGREEMSMTALDNAYMSIKGTNQQTKEKPRVSPVYSDQGCCKFNFAIPIEPRDSPRPTGHKRSRTS